MAKVAAGSQKARGGAKPGERRGGRKPGTPNKITADLKAAIQMAANKAHPDGVVGYLTHQAEANPNAFMALLGRTLPKEITGEGGKPLFPERAVEMTEAQLLAKAGDNRG